MRVNSQNSNTLAQDECTFQLDPTPSEIGNQGSSIAHDSSTHPSQSMQCSCKVQPSHLVTILHKLSNLNTHIQATTKFDRHDIVQVKKPNSAMVTRKKLGIFKPNPRYAL